METIFATIGAALISGITAVIVNAIQHRRTDALLEYRLTQLEEKVDKHNNLVERTYELEKTGAVIKNDIKVVNHRIDDLEQKNGKD